MSVLSLETYAAWRRDQFKDAFRHSRIICIVAETSKNIVGFLVYQLFDDHFRILNFGVDCEKEEKDRENVIKFAIDAIIGKLDRRRTRIEVPIPEDDEENIRLLGAIGLTSGRIVPGAFGKRDGILMGFSKQQTGVGRGKRK